MRGGTAPGGLPHTWSPGPLAVARVAGSLGLMLVWLNRHHDQAAGDQLLVVHPDQDVGGLGQAGPVRSHQQEDRRARIDRNRVMAGLQPGDGVDDDGGEGFTADKRLTSGEHPHPAAYTPHRCNRSRQRFLRGHWRNSLRWDEAVQGVDRHDARAVPRGGCGGGDRSWVLQGDANVPMVTTVVFKRQTINTRIVLELRTRLHVVPAGHLYGMLTRTVVLDFG